MHGHHPCLHVRAYEERQSTMRSEREQVDRRMLGESPEDDTTQGTMQPVWKMVSSL